MSGILAEARRAGVEHVALHSSRSVEPTNAVVNMCLKSADAMLLFGTDTPSDSIYTNPPGLNGLLKFAIGRPPVYQRRSCSTH